MKKIFATVLVICIAVFVAVNFFGMSIDSLVGVNKITELVETVTEKTPELVETVTKNVQEVETSSVPEPIIGRIVVPGNEDSHDGFAKKKNQSILVSDVSFISMPKNFMLLAYRDEVCGKYGFVRNNSGMTVCILPEYDDVRNTGYSLIPVIKNGKFGIVDGAMRHHLKDEPIVPCEYDDIQVIDNNTAILIKGGKKEKITFDIVI